MNANSCAVCVVTGNAFVLMDTTDVVLFGLYK